MKVEKDITAWLFEVINNGSWKRYNDLHIDEIDINYKNKSTWFDGGIKCHDYAMEIIKGHNLPYTIELVFPLKSKKTNISHIVKDFQGLKQSLSHTPPSLYVFHNDCDDLKELKLKGEKIEYFLYQKKSLKGFYYYQAYDDDNEIRRVLYRL